MGVIYKLTHIESGKSYVGQTTRSIRARLRDHKSKPGCPYMSQAIKKYGMDAFKVDILAEVQTRQELNELEAQYIKEFNTTYPNGYNLRNGGDGSYHNTESKKKISEKAKEQFSSADVRTASSTQRGGQEFVLKDIYTGEVVYTGVNKAEVCRKFGLHRTSLQKILKGKQLSTGGLTAKYVGDPSVWPTSDLLEEFQLDLRRYKGFKLDCPTWLEWLNNREDA